MSHQDARLPDWGPHRPPGRAPATPAVHALPSLDGRPLFRCLAAVRFRALFAASLSVADSALWRRANCPVAASMVWRWLLPIFLLSVPVLVCTFDVDEVRQH